MSEENSRAHRIELELTAGGYGSVVKIDGERLKGVTRAVVIANAGKATRVSGDLVALDGVTISGDAGIYQGRVCLWPTFRSWLLDTWWVLNLRRVLRRR